MFRKYLAAAIFVLAVLPGTSWAQMYKCTGPNGEITFTKHGCATDNDTAKIEVGRVNSQDSRAARQNIEEYEYRRSARPQGTRVTVVADPRIAERQAKARMICAVKPIQRTKGRRTASRSEERRVG